jgi:hypothetical protein
MHSDEVKIPKPCDEPWENMSGCGVERHCARCAKSVYDLSEMTEDEVEQLMTHRPPNLCVSYLTDDHGLIQLKRKSRAGVVVGLALSLAACSNPFKRTGGAPPQAVVVPRAIGSVAPATPPAPAVTPSSSASSASVPPPSASSAKGNPPPKLKRLGGAPVRPDPDSKNSGY